MNWTMFLCGLFLFLLGSAGTVFFLVRNLQQDEANENAAWISSNDDWRMN